MVKFYWRKNIKKPKNQHKKFYISPTFLLSFLFSFFAGNGYLFLLYTLSVFMHELMHIIVAEKLGYSLHKFELSILGASMKLESESFYGMDELKIAIAGPLFNLCLFIFLVGSWWTFPVLYNYTFDFAIVNLFVFALNILPIFSLDGGRILVSLLSVKLDRKKCVKIVRNIGLVFAIMFFILFIISFFVNFNFSLGVISIFLFISCTSAGKTEFVKMSVLSKKDKIKKGISLEEKRYIFSENARLLDMYRKLKSNTYTCFEIVRDNKNNLIIDEDELMVLMEKNGATSSVFNCF